MDGHLLDQAPERSFPIVNQHNGESTQRPVTKFIGIRMVPRIVSLDKVSFVSLFAFAISMLICAK